MKLNKKANELTSMIPDTKAKAFLKSMFRSGRNWTSRKFMEICKAAGSLSVMPIDECNVNLLYTTNSASASDIKKCLRLEYNGQKTYLCKWNNCAIGHDSIVEMDIHIVQHAYKDFSCHWNECEEKCIDIPLLEIHALNHLYGVRVFT
ncbi:hypothetical protein ACF0H5_005209 [Mactra antiquata]